MPSDGLTDDGEVASESETTLGGEKENARYECRCGSVVVVKPENFNHLRWAYAKFGFRNPTELIQHHQSCCERPEYMEVNGWDHNVE